MSDDDFTLLDMVMDALESVQVSMGAWGYPKAEEARAALRRIREQLDALEWMRAEQRWAWEKAAARASQAQDLAAGNMNIAIANAETAAEYRKALEEIRAYEGCMECDSIDIARAALASSPEPEEMSDG